MSNTKNFPSIFPFLLVEQKLRLIKKEKAFFLIGRDQTRINLSVFANLAARVYMCVSFAWVLAPAIHFACNHELYRFLEPKRFVRNSMASKNRSVTFDTFFDSIIYVSRKGNRENAIARAAKGNDLPEKQKTIGFA